MYGSLYFHHPAGFEKQQDCGIYVENLVERVEGQAHVVANKAFLSRLLHRRVQGKLQMDIFSGLLAFALAFSCPLLVGPCAFGP